MSWNRDDESTGEVPRLSPPEDLPGIRVENPRRLQCPD
jgi:hypothetical protein